MKIVFVALLLIFSTLSCSSVNKNSKHENVHCYFYPNNFLG